MKRLFTHFIPIVALVAILVGCSKDGSNGDYKCAVSDKAVAVARCNINQLLDKSGEKSHLLEMLRTKLESEDMPDFILEMAKDLRCTGIDIEAPLFIYAEEIDEDNMFLGVVAKTYNESLLDNLIKHIGRGHVIRTEESDYTLVERGGSNDVALAYNDVATVLGFVVPQKWSYSNGDCDAKPYVIEAVENAYNGNGGGAWLPAHEEADVAVCGNVETLLALCKKYNVDIEASIVGRLKMFEGVRGATIDVVLNTMPGSIDCRVELRGTTLSECGALCACSSDNLKYVSADALAVVNLPFDGGTIINLINELRSKSPEFAHILDREISKATGNTLDSSWVLKMAASPLKSLGGELTLAIDDIDGREIEASAVVGVDNDSIMRLVRLANMINVVDMERVGGDNYLARVGGANYYFGQKAGLFYISTEGEIEPAKEPANRASWYSAAEESYGYIAANLSSILAIQEIRAQVEAEVAKECGSSSESVMTWLKSLDAILFTAPTPESVSLQLLFKNKDENPLVPIADAVKQIKNL